ncbi:hypothetical protein [Streptomyces sp. NPDC090445]|uniref:hypothetical protein n=1 Tax=Streptomyces sp. NPDC090445 TaxID=3365963 RepID=UPI00381BAFE2
MGQLPPDAFDAAQIVCEGITSLTEITNRRGSAVWKVTGPAETVAVKYGTGEGVAVTSRDAEVLYDLERPDDLLAGGSSREVAWVINRWIDAPSTWKRFESVRAGNRSTPGR